MNSFAEPRQSFISVGAFESLAIVLLADVLLLAGIMLRIWAAGIWCTSACVAFELGTGSETACAVDIGSALAGWG